LKCGVQLTCEVVLEPNVDDPRLTPGDPAVVSESMVRPAPCIESLPDKDGQTAGPVEHNNGGV
ncbi:hypothetical protein A2U01_0071937, partial [Trifolium medium]|nr:hypothetical protein [Trifolium medium]